MPLDFTLTEDQRALQRTVGDFADRHLVPNARRMDEARSLDPKVLAEGARIGIYGLNVAEEYGGLGLDTVSIGLVAAELGRGCGSTALSVLAHTVLTCEHLRRRGTPAQKAAYLPKLATGEWVGAWGLTEPGGGSDVLAMKTSARRETKSNEQGWVIDGEKCFITNGSKGDVVVVTARTSEGFGAFVLRKGTPGLEGKRTHELACMRASDTASLRFDGCRVGPDAALGDPGKALKDSFACLDLERVIAGAMLTSMARECLRRSVAYSQQRRAFGKPIGAFQGVYEKLADLDVAVASCELLWRESAWKRDRGEPFTHEAARAKLAAARLAKEAALLAIDVHGGAGLEIRSEFERFLRDSLLGTIGGGTSEIQQAVIARGLGLDVDLGG
ncbi:MAG: acyl-CoA dehydrogenase family protein [Thermoplasmatota archaeon]